MKTWGIKLGSNGCYVNFCEEYGIIGIGWKDVSLDLVQNKDRETLYNDHGVNGHAFGTLERFVVEANIGDYVLYYHPIAKQITLARITGNAEKRDFSLELDNVDIWFLRKVEIINSYNLVDFDASLKGSLLGYKGSFCCIENEDIPYSHCDLLAHGKDPYSQDDEAIRDAYNNLHRLICNKMSSLDPTDFEHLIADYIVSMGFRISERIGGNLPVIDIKGIGPFGTICKAQVRRTGGAVSKTEVQHCINNAGECDYFIFASLNGFSESLEGELDPEVILLDAKSDELFKLILSGKCSERVMNKIRWY